ncbi:hypothetical protein Tco_0508051 [Tanacetum coccineum]
MTSPSNLQAPLSPPLSSKYCMVTSLSPHVSRDPPRPPQPSTLLSYTSIALNTHPRPSLVIYLQLLTLSHQENLANKGCVTKPLLSLDILLPSIRFPNTVKSLYAKRPPPSWTINHLRVNVNIVNRTIGIDESRLYEPDRMPPKRMSTSKAPAMTQAAIRKLVADSVSTSLEAQAANMENTDNTTRPREAHVARQCSYKEFMCCQPINFKDCKVMFIAGTLSEEALSWWNSFAQPIGIEEAYKIT